MCANIEEYPSPTDLQGISGTKNVNLILLGEDLGIITIAFSRFGISEILSSIKGIVQISLCLQEELQHVSHIEASQISS